MKINTFKWPRSHKQFWQWCVTYWGYLSPSILDYYVTIDIADNIVADFFPDWIPRTKRDTLHKTQWNLSMKWTKRLGALIQKNINWTNIGRLRCLQVMLQKRRLFNSRWRVQTSWLISNLEVTVTVENTSVIIWQIWDFLTHHTLHCPVQWYRYIFLFDVIQMHYCDRREYLESTHTTELTIPLSQ